MSSIRKKAVQGIQIGDRFVVTRTITEADVLKFADVTRDYNPVHFEERFAKAKNFNGLISHGLLAASLLTEIGGQIGWLATEMNFKFKKPVYFGDTIRCALTITDIDKKGFARAEAKITNAQGIVAIESMLKGILPGSKEKNVMSQMLSEGDPTNFFSSRCFTPPKVE